MVRSILVAVVMTASIAGAQQVQAPATLPPGSSCITGECHTDVTKDRFLHGPVNLRQCEPCHVQVGNRHEFQVPPQGRDLCLMCHEAEKAKPVVHQPFAADCTFCHNPHGADNRYFTKGGEGEASCRLCHGNVTEGLAFIHGPLALGECVACHTPHQSDHKGLLTEDPSSLCLSCHVDVERSMEAAISVHQPMKDGCAQCHGAHGGQTQFFLPAAGQDLCRQCHGDFLAEVAEYKHAHTPMVEGKQCSNCHQPHTSNQESLLQVAVGNLCLSCHNTTIQLDGRTIENISNQVTSAKYLHGPLVQNNCVACHQAHGSDFADILKKEFPPDFYAPYSDEAYDLCFDCHDKKIVQSANSIDTGFRDGMNNLHFLHVNREKGRSCRACHHEHASNQENHIRSEVPFGRWTMKVEFTKTDTGGGCTTGCHVPYSYDRENPVGTQTSGN